MFDVVKVIKQSNILFNSNLTLDQCCKGKIIKQVGEILPHICISVLPQAFIIEPITAEGKNKMKLFVFQANKVSLQV